MLMGSGIFPIAMLLLLLKMGVLCIFLELFHFTQLFSSVVMKLLYSSKLT